MTAKSYQPAAGYSPRFEAAFKDLMKVEGGFVDNRHDAGGATIYGISLRFLIAEGRVDLDRDGRADFDLDMDGDIDGQDVRRLTPDHARALYWRCFWLRIGAEQFARPLGEALFDQAVNGGIVSAGKLLQRAVNTCLMGSRLMGSRAATRLELLAVDGRIGPATHKAVAWVLRWPGLGMPSLIAAFRSAAKERYRSIAQRNPSQQVFLKGWLARADRLGR